MAELRIVRKLFACTSFVFALVFLITLPTVIRAPYPHATSRFHFEPIGILLILMREIILFLPPFMAVVNGMAWWAAKNGRPAARLWAITSSTMFLVFSVPFFVADIVILEYAMTGTVAIIGVFLSSLIFSGIGITGLAFFSRCEALTPVSAAMPHHA